MNSDEGSRNMETKFQGILRSLIAEAIDERLNERLTPIEKRQDKFESVLTRMYSNMARIDSHMDYMARRFKDEDEAKSI